MYAPARCRSAYQSTAADPTLPMGSAICFCAYRLFTKRRNRNPEGPFFGNSPIWGAVFTTMLGLVIAGFVSPLFLLCCCLGAALGNPSCGAAERLVPCSAGQLAVCHDGTTS